MEKRKLISFGSSSYIISIPKTWINQNNLKKGDIVSIEDKKGELILTAGENNGIAEQSRIIINTEEKNMDHIKSEIISAYLKNYDVIEIHDVYLKERTAEIKKILRELIGLEIISQERGKICVKDLLDIQEISIETLVRRMDNILRSMLIDSLACTEEDRAEEIYERDIEVNRLFFLTSRTIRAAMKDHLIAKRMKMNNVDLLFSWTITNKIEKLGDLIKRTVRRMRRIEMTADEKSTILKIINDINNNYTTVMKAYYKKDFALALETEIIVKKTLSNHRKILDEHKNLSFRWMIHATLAMTSYISDITRAVMGMEEGI